MLFMEYHRACSSDTPRKAANPSPTHSPRTSPSRVDLCASAGEQGQRGELDRPLDQPDADEQPRRGIQHPEHAADREGAEHPVEGRPNRPVPLIGTCTTSRLKESMRGTGMSSVDRPLVAH
jgi:hypothetical protein